MHAPVRCQAVEATAADAIREVAGQLHDVLSARRAEMDAAARLPADLAAELAAAGLMRMGVAADLGGPEVHPVEQLQVIESLAGVNPAAAWCVMISSTTSLLSGWLAGDAAEAVFGDPLGIWAGGVAPSGRLVDGVLSGRWAFGSGCQNATWFAGGAVGPEGDYRLCAVPAVAVRIDETWDTVGLRGTGSHHWSVDGAAVPADFQVDMFRGAPVSSAPLYGMGLFGMLASAVAAVGLGAARAALDALVDLAAAKTPAFATRSLATRSPVQAEVARNDAALGAARTYLHSCVRDRFDAAAAGVAASMEARARVRRAAAHAAATAADVVEAAFRLAGGSAAHADAPFGRLLLDVEVLNGHQMVAPSIWEPTGAVLLGLPVERPDL